MMIEQPPITVANTKAGVLLAYVLSIPPNERLPILFQQLANLLERECNERGRDVFGDPCPHTTAGVLLAGATMPCRFAILINKSDISLGYRASSMHPDQWNFLPAGKRVAILNEQPFVLEWKASEPAKVFCRWVP